MRSAEGYGRPIGEHWGAERAVRMLQAREVLYGRRYVEGAIFQKFSSTARGRRFHFNGRGYMQYDRGAAVFSIERCKNEGDRIPTHNGQTLNAAVRHDAIAEERPELVSARDDSVQTFDEQSETCEFTKLDTGYDARFKRFCEDTDRKEATG